MTKDQLLTRENLKTTGLVAVIGAPLMVLLDSLFFNPNATPLEQLAQNAATFLKPDEAAIQLAEAGGGIGLWYQAYVGLSKFINNFKKLGKKDVQAEP